jgi:hypothetical protein
MIQKKFSSFLPLGTMKMKIEGSADRDHIIALTNLAFVMERSNMI